MTRLPLIGFLAFLIPGSAAVAASALPRSTPEEQGVDPAGILALVDALDHRIDSVHSFVLVRHGKLVAEGWWAPYAPQDVHIMYSVTKSFTGTAVGFAVQEGLLSVNDKVLSFFPDLAPAHPSGQMVNMRVKDLLTMTTGHQTNTIDGMRAHTDGAWVKAFLATDVEHRPGTHFLYNSGASYVLAAIVQRVTGKTVEEYLTPRLFEPLGIDQHPWGESPEGIDQGDGGLQLRTEDLAKFGLFYLQKGVWEGHRLLPEKWVQAATTKESSSGSDPDSNWDYGYGYQFWMNKAGGFRSDGALGQFCFVLPDYDTVLAVTSGTSSLAGIMDTVWEKLLPALHYVAIPADPAAEEKLRERIASLALAGVAGDPRAALEASVSKKTFAFAENELGLKAAGIDFSGERPVITITDADGAHPIVCGVGAWVRGRTGFYKRISSLFDRPDQGIAATGAWTAPDTFTAKLCFDETPYTLTVTFHYDGGRLLVDVVHNLRWGKKTHPQFVGTPAP